jgi:hypothetical protein
MERVKGIEPSYRRRRGDGRGWRSHVASSVPKDHIGVSKQEEEPCRCDEEQCSRKDNTGATLLGHRPTIWPLLDNATKLAR